MILACHNISKSFGDNTIVKMGSFHIEEREKAALVGLNGAGKSTILKMIMKELSLDSGEIILAKGKTVGYLSQHQELKQGDTIYQELETAKETLITMEQQIRTLEMDMKHLSGDELEHTLQVYHRLTHTFEQQNGYSYKSEIIGVLKGLGFSETDFDKKVSTLSGGEKTRVSLGKLLLTIPDVLILDEPTNHLDLNSISWLENYLMNYQGAVLLVSHDRYFINRVVTKVIDIENGVLSTYLGNYTDFSLKKQQVRDAKLKEYFNQQQEIKHQEAVIKKLKSFNREKSVKRAESREKLLSKMVPVEKPFEVTNELHFSLDPHILSGMDVLTVEHLRKAYEKRTLFDDLSFDIKRGEHVAIIGDNGTGKTTILKILNNVIDSDSGSFSLGSNVEIGYYDQEHHVLHTEKSIFNEISDDYPNLTNTQIRNTLAAFLFTGDDVFKQIKDLSGGERGRVSLAKLMLSNANFLILDEPTNHLDIASKEILEQALNEYTGTVLYVSHDRYFINETATRILDLSNSRLTNYLGNYDYYLEKKETMIHKNDSPINDLTSTKETQETKLDWKAQKEADALIRKQKNDLEKTEKSIADLEDEIQKIDLLMADPNVFTDVEQCITLSAKKDNLLMQLEELLILWENLS